MTNFEALVSVSQTLIRHQLQDERPTIGDIVNTVWDVVEHFDVGDCFRDVANQAIVEIERRMLPENFKLARAD